MSNHPPKPVVGIIDWAKAPVSEATSLIEREVIGEAAEVRYYLCDSDADFNDEICSAQALIVWHNTPVTTGGIARLKNCRVIIATASDLTPWM